MKKETESKRALSHSSGRSISSFSSLMLLQMEEGGDFENNEKCCRLLCIYVYFYTHRHSGRNVKSFIYYIIFLNRRVCVFFCSTIFYFVCKFQRRKIRDI